MDEMSVIAGDIVSKWKRFLKTITEYPLELADVGLCSLHFIEGEGFYERTYCKICSILWASR